MKPFDFLKEALAGQPVNSKNGIFGKGIQDIPNAQRDPLYKKVYSRYITWKTHLPEPPNED